MASAATVSHSNSKPSLAVTYEGDDIALLERILPLIDTIEISPDAIARSDWKRTSLRSEVLQEYQAVQSGVNFVAHGVGLSIGSFDHWDEGYLRLLDELFARFQLEWHSEHLAYTVVAGENVGTMFALPRTDEALDLVCERVRLAAGALSRPFPSRTRHSSAARLSRAIFSRRFFERHHLAYRVRTASGCLQPGMRCHESRVGHRRFSRRAQSRTGARTSSRRRRAA